MVVPLVAMWLLLPLMVFTALLCIGLFAMPAISKHVGSRHYPQLEQRHGGSLLGSIGYSLSSFVIFGCLAADVTADFISTCESGLTTLVMGLAHLSRDRL
jgi:hypothetical protein